MDLSYQILLAFLIDLLIGDPRGYPHPVRIIGCIAKRLESITRKHFANQTTAGTATTGCIVGGTFIFTLGLLWALKTIHPMAETAGSIFLIYTCISVRSLYAESRPVFCQLSKGRVDLARTSLANIVGRDTENLDKKEISRATVETVAESTVDGIIAPLFYACLGGAPLAMAYKAISTLDSMFGYRNEIYRNFGKVPARLDDAANWIPARLGGFLMAAAAALCGFDGKRSLKTVKRDGANHLSPNAGIPEAAMAGALGIRLGGPSFYGKQKVVKPYIGTAENEIDLTDIQNSHKIMFVSSALSLTLFAGIRKLLEGT
ncbi:MAG: cobalamin biosynthesis protein CobD [Nitrospinaceae bacterium]|nr:MAG: cobalamin biosynthesis protein CobD [Nitrospinaceae bacterium]